MAGVVSVLYCRRNCYCIRKEMSFETPFNKILYYTDFYSFGIGRHIFGAS